MQDFSLVLAGFLLINFAIGLIPVMRGPSIVDRMLASQLLGTTTVAIVLVLADAQNDPVLREVALILALVSLVAAAAFVRAVNADPDSEEQ